MKGHFNTFDDFAVGRHGAEDVMACFVRHVSISESNRTFFLPLDPFSLSFPFFVKPSRYEDNGVHASAGPLEALRERMAGGLRVGSSVHGLYEIGRVVQRTLVSICFNLFQ